MPIEHISDRIDAVPLDDAPIYIGRVFQQCSEDVEEAGAGAVRAVFGATMYKSEDGAGFATQVRSTGTMPALLVLLAGSLRQLLVKIDADPNLDVPPVLLADLEDDLVALVEAAGAHIGH